MAETPYSAQDEMALMSLIWDPAVADDPENFVMTVYPWGKAGTPLEHHPGPRTWQRSILRSLKDHIAQQENKLLLDLPLEMYKEAVASGRGIGKSTLVAWIAHWFMSTRLGGSVLISANTEPQLKTVTWGEIGKWLALAINGHWFDKAATSIKPQDWFAAGVKRDLKIDDTYWATYGKLWSEENPDAYAGPHNHNGLLLIFDEASGIPECIWSVANGYFTDPVLHRYWLSFSNPRRNTGAFFECFHAQREYWRTRNIDSRTVEGTDVAHLNAIVAQHGEDSDVARVEVYGQFPTVGAKQFIGPLVVRNAQEREIENDYGAPLVMGVDVARFGDDRSVIAFRQGRDARSIPWQHFKGLDTMQLASRVADCADKYKPQAIFIDGGGVGGGVVDRLKSLGYRIIEVQAGASADDKNKYLNKRVEMWDRMREWLTYGAIPSDKELAQDLTGPEYDYNVTNGQIKLERKDEMKRRGFHSPDFAEALAQTFALPVARTDMKHSRHNRRGHVAQGVNSPVFG